MGFTHVTYKVIEFKLNVLDIEQVKPKDVIKSTATNLQDKLLYMQTWQGIYIAKHCNVNRRCIWNMCTLFAKI
jgi:hypothetical protein